LQQSDHKLISQVGQNTVGDIRAEQQGLITPNHWFSRILPLSP